MTGSLPALEEEMRMAPVVSTMALTSTKRSPSQWLHFNLTEKCLPRFCTR